MNLYELNWDWYDDFASYLFSHPEPKTQDEFRNDVRSLLTKYGPDYLGSEDSYASAEAWIRFAAEHLGELGYEAVNPIRVVFGGSIILREDDARWREYASDELFEAAVRKNTKIDDQWKNSR